MDALEPLSKEDLGEKLCEHCSLTSFGTKKINTRPENLCEGANCEEAYVLYLESLQEDLDTEAEENARAWDQLSKKNDAFIASLGRHAVRCFPGLIADVIVTGEITFVSEPRGSRNNERFGPFRQVYVRQVFHYEDSCSGSIYARIGKRWIEIPFIV